MGQASATSSPSIKNRRVADVGVCSVTCSGLCGSCTKIGEEMSALRSLGTFLREKDSVKRRFLGAPFLIVDCWLGDVGEVGDRLSVDDVGPGLDTGEAGRDEDSAFAIGAGCNSRGLGDRRGDLPGVIS